MKKTEKYRIVDNEGNEVLFGVSHRNLDELKIEWLMNDTYQVIDESENVLHQGSISDCNNYLSAYYGG